MNSLLDALNCGITVIFVGSDETDYYDDLDDWDETLKEGYFDVKPAYNI